MASSSPGLSHLGVTDNQKRWLVVGIALNKILVPQIRPFVEQEVDKEYNNLKTNHSIHTQSTSGRLQRWPARILNYENINGNSLHTKLPGGKYNFSLFDCRVLSHVDFAKLYVRNYMAKFSAFDDSCDASAVLTLLGGVPVFLPVVQAAAGDVMNIRNDWAHCVFSKWDPFKFQQSFIEMEHLVRVMALPAADEAKLFDELKDWETKGTLLCMNSPVDPALLHLVQQEVKFLQDHVNNLSVEFDQDKMEVQQELQNTAVILKEMKQMVERLKIFQADADQRFGQVKDQVHSLKKDADQRFGSLETRTRQVEDHVHSLKETIHDLSQNITATSSASLQDLLVPSVVPEKLVELIRRDYKGAVLCPFPWCEDELQLKLSNIFTRLQIVSRTKERSKLTHSTVNMTDVFKPHPECYNPRVVLIEGNPGMGKTTYCQKLAYDWSVGEIPPDASFPEVKILLLLKCRDMHMKTANIEEAIADQLLPHDASKKEKEGFFHFIRSNQSKILLVLDGFDELREDLVQGFLPLIQGKVFANAYLMLTARHEAGMKVRRYCDTLLEIVGYTQDDVESYIKKYFSSHENKNLADKVIEQLCRDKKLRELTVNPLNTALLCLLCEETGGVFPSKKKKLYDGLVSCALRTHFAKNCIFLGDEDPIERCTNELNLLGKMAFEALLKNQLHFNEDEMKSQTNANFLQLPFLSREPSVSKIKPTPCYAFTHKTFQEYLAAFYLAHQLLSGDKENERLLDELSPIDNWQVWEFLISLVSTESGEVAVNVVSRLCDFLRSKKLQGVIDADVDLDVEVFEEKPHDWAKYLTEWSKDEILLCHVVNKTLGVIAECEEDDNELKDYQKEMVNVLSHCLPLKKFELTPSTGACRVHRQFLNSNDTLTDLLLNSALDPLLLATIKHGSHSKNNLVHFNLSNEMYSYSTVSSQRASFHSFSNLHQSFKELLLEAVQPNSFLTHFNLDSIWISISGARAIAEFLQTNRSLTHLNLRNAMIRDEGATALGNALQSNCTLTHLSLPENWIGVVGTEELATSLQSNSALIYLDLSYNVGSDAVASALSEAVESNCALQYLDISQRVGSSRMIGPEGGSALARALLFNCRLTYLNLYHNDIGDTGAASLGEALQTNSTLTELNLGDNQIEDRGAVALGKALLSNRSLTHLRLDCNVDIGYLGVAAIAKALQSNDSRLTQLDLGFNFISSQGATAIASALHTNNSLTHLGLWDNGITSSGAAAIAKALQSNRTLTHVDLRENGISDSGATELARVIENHNNTLVYLDLRANYSIGSAGRERLEHVDQTKCIVKYKGWP